MTTYKDGKAQKTIAKPYISSIDWDTFENTLDRAENREDLLTAEDFICLAACLSQKNKHPTTGDALPVPGYMREFLARAFFEIAAGKDPSDALRMKPKGAPKKWSLHDKTMACQLVNEIIRNGVKPTQAYKEAANIINEKFGALNPSSHESPAWSAFFGKKINWSTIRDWYSVYSPTLQKARPQDQK